MPFVKDKHSVRIFFELLSSLQSTVGWKISRSRDFIKVKRTEYIFLIFQSIRLQKAKSTNKPLPLNAEIFTAHENEPILASSLNTDYPFIGGALLYITMSTRSCLFFSIYNLALDSHAVTKWMRHISNALWDTSSRKRTIWYTRLFRTNN